MTASELATAQSFVMELCELLDVPKPHPTPAQDYMFERPVTFTHGDGPAVLAAWTATGAATSCWKPRSSRREATRRGLTMGCCVPAARAKTTPAPYLPVRDDLLFVLVVDVGTVIEVYAEFSRSGGTYSPFPDPRSHRIMLADLARPELRERLQQIWTQPDALNPALISAKVTREVSQQLALLARSLEQAGHAPDAVAAYLSRCLFSMFAEDVELLPKGSFQTLLQQHRESPQTVQRSCPAVSGPRWTRAVSLALVKPVLRFNGKLFKWERESETYSLLLTLEQLDLLIHAARSNWREVEPAIFGTLLERALDPSERHSLGAHYTPRAYVLLTNDHRTPAVGVGERPSGGAAVGP